MLLCTISYYASESAVTKTVRYVSNKPLKLTNHFWEPSIILAPTISYGLNKPFGGRVIVEIGDLELVPTIFDLQGSEMEGAWLPPLTVDILFEYADDDDGSGDTVLLFEGTAHRTKTEHSVIGYELYSQDPTFKVRSLKIEQSLGSLFTDFVQMWTPDYTLVSTYATGVSSVDVELITPDTEMLFIDILAEVCENYGYFFYIDHVEEEVHLVKMSTRNGPYATEITEYDFFPSRYTDPVPIKYVNVGGTKVAGEYAYGEEINFDNICVSESFIRIGDNSGDDEVWMVHLGSVDDGGDDIFIPYDSTKLYRFTLEYRKVAGTHAVWGGFHCMASKTVSNNTAGADAYSSQHHIFSRSGVADNKWHTVTGYMSDTSSTAADCSEAGVDGTTIKGTIPFINARTGTIYIRPLIIANHSDTGGETDIRYCAIHEIEFDNTNKESDGAIVSTLFEYKADHFNGDAWYFHDGATTLIETSSQDAIDNIVSISKEKTVELNMPLLKDNIHAMGQELTWTDESQHKSINAAMKIRKRTFDFNEDEIFVLASGTVVATSTENYLKDSTVALEDGTEYLEDGP